MLRQNLKNTTRLLLFRHIFASVLLYKIVLLKLSRKLQTYVLRKHIYQFTNIKWLKLKNQAVDISIPFIFSLMLKTNKFRKCTCANTSIAKQSFGYKQCSGKYFKYRFSKKDSYSIIFHKNSNNRVYVARIMWKPALFCAVEGRWLTISWL